MESRGDHLANSVFLSIKDNLSRFFSLTSLKLVKLVKHAFAEMFLQFYLNENGERVYTLKVTTASCLRFTYIALLHLVWYTLELVWFSFVTVGARSCKTDRFSFF